MDLFMQPQITTGDIINCIEQAAPLHWQEDYDNAGLIVGNRKNICTGVLVCLDVCPSTLSEAISLNCNLIVSHHPFIFRPVKKIVHNSPTEKILSSAIKNDISIYASHTNMDSSSIGVNYMLAEKLGLKSLQPIDNGKYAAEENYLGEGAMGYTDNEIPAEEFLIKVKSVLNLPFIKYSGDISQNVHKVCICGGSGSFLVNKAIENDCNIMLTADIKYHDFLESEEDIILADIGHFESEQFIKEQIVNIISKKFRNFAPLYISKEQNRVKFL